MARSILLLHPPVQAVSLPQLYNYAEPYPYGLLKLGTLLKRAGHEVRLIDMMEYGHLEGSFVRDWPGNSELHSVKHAGNNRVPDALKPSYLLGKNMAWLRARLKASERPDEIWVSSCLTYNWETTHEAIQVCKEVWPDVFVKLGGNYPTLEPDLAKTSLADEIVSGIVEEAEREFADISLFETMPELGLFNLATGCSNRCTFCVNHRHPPCLRFSSKQLLYYFLNVKKRFGITHFSNWDPNVTLFPDAMAELFDTVAAVRAGLTFSFNMGLQPNRITRELALKMQRAGVVEMTIPVESTDPAMLRRFQKPYGHRTAARTLLMLKDIGFDIGHFHTTCIVGYDDESPRHLFRTYLLMALLGSQPIFFPINPVPTSKEFERLQPVLHGKPQDELNGYLFPLQNSKEKVELYDVLVTLGCSKHLEDAEKLARTLPQELERQFFEELDGVKEELTQLKAEVAPSVSLEF